MISVIISGRNDSHGYNLQRRAGLSLNCLAAVLTDPADEIVFVDYNTPDDLPTFIEAIDDQLSPHAKGRIRTIRVRGWVHKARVAAMPYPIADVIARNIGLRRTSPNNQWVLITTSDVILVPNRDGSFSELVGRLGGAYYEMPRFELPELVWESLDRRDPHTALRSVHALSHALHLREIVREGGHVMFDNPGDFQLAHRSDLFAIDGYDEAMTIGWQHSDSNLARRLSLLRGPPEDLLGHLSVYHLSHVRGGSATHASERLENDLQAFVHDLTSPYVVEQRGTWGMPDIEFEEIGPRSTRAQRALDTLLSMLPGSPQPDYVADRGTAGFGRMDYPTAHVFPHLCDLLACLPPNAEVAYVGGNIELVRLLATFAERTGLAPPTVLAGGVEQQEIDDYRGAPWRLVSAVDYGSLHSVIFDFGFDTASLPLAGRADRMRTCSELVQHVFNECTESDRASGKGTRFIAINAIHTPFESAIDAALESYSAPYSTRIRHGYVRGSSGADQRALISDVRHFIAQQTGRTAPVPLSELSRTWAHFRLARRAATIDDIEPSWCRSELLAFMHSPALREIETIEPKRLAQLAEWVDMRRPSRTLRSGILLPVIDGPVKPAPKLCSLVCLKDWDDPGWFAASRLLPGYKAGLNSYERARTSWEYIHLIYGLQRLGILRRGSRIALLGCPASDFIEAIGRTGAQMSMLGRHSFSESANLDPVLSDEFNCARLFDAILAPHNEVFRFGLSEAVRLMQWAECNVTVGGVLAFSLEVGLSGPIPTGLSAGVLRDRRFERAIAELTNFDVTGSFDPIVAADTLDRFARKESKWVHRPHLVLGEGDSIRAPSVWFLKRKLDRYSAWDQVYEIFNGA